MADIKSKQQLNDTDVVLADFVCTREVTLTDDDIERLKRRDEFDIVTLEKRGIKLVKNHVQ